VKTIPGEVSFMAAVSSIIICIAFSTLVLTSLELAFASDPAGIVELFIVHSDGNDLLESSEFVSTENDMEGYYSIYNDDQEFLTDAQTCNLDHSCSLSLAPGIYVAMVDGPLSFKTYSVPFEILDNQTTHASIAVDQGSYKVTVTDDNNHSVDYEDFQHPGDFRELGWFALYDLEGNFLMDAETCNLSDSCSYPFETGTFVAAVKKVTDELILACQFEIADHEQTSVKFDMDSGTCNQEATHPPASTNYLPNSDNDDDDNNTPDEPTNDNDATTSNPVQNPAQTDPKNILQRRTVSIMNSSHYVDNDGVFHLVGEVQNTQGIPATDVTVTGVFYSNSTKDVLAVKRTSSIQETLSPSETSPFEILVKDAGAAHEIGDYTISAFFSNDTSAIKPGKLGLTSFESSYSNDTGLYHVNGTVFNYGDSSAHFVRVAVSFYDQNQTIIYLAQKYIASQLPSSSLSEFEIDFLPINSSKIASVSALVQSKEYSMVRSENKMLASPVQITLDSQRYDNGGIIQINGTIGVAVSWERYALVYILWPDGESYDKELALVSDDGTYRDEIAFYSSEEHRGETFTVRVIYNNNFAENHFVFSK